IIQLPEAEEGAPSFADSQGYIWRLVETVDTPEAAEHLAKPTTSTTPARNGHGSGTGGRQAGSGRPASSFPAVTATCSRRHLTARRYWQFAQDRRITEEGLRYPMRSDAYRYYLDMENLNRKELLEAGVTARLLDEGYASFVEGEIQQ